MRAAKEKQKKYLRSLIMVAKPKTEIMKAMRLKRQQMGLVEFNAWLTPEHKQKLQDLLAKLTKD